MKTKTLVIFYLILLLTGIAINCSSQNVLDEEARDQFNTDGINKPGIRSNKSYGMVNCFDNLNSICSLYYSGNAKAA
ncbi:MAG: hypothetical protein GXO89_08390 [Chlorobi bacterium]|nr:hypothetical protein [Chlorobiota bacterium]